MPDSNEVEFNQLAAKSVENSDQAHEQKDVGEPQFKQEEEVDFLQAEIDAQAKTLSKEEEESKEEGDAEGGRVADERESLRQSCHGR